MEDQEFFFFLKIGKEPFTDLLKANADQYLMHLTHIMHDNLDNDKLENFSRNPIKDHIEFNRKVVELFCEYLKLENEEAITEIIQDHEKRDKEKQEHNEEND